MVRDPLHWMGFAARTLSKWVVTITRLTGKDDTVRPNFDKTSEYIRKDKARYAGNPARLGRS